MTILTRGFSDGSRKYFFLIKCKNIVLWLPGVGGARGIAFSFLRSQATGWAPAVSCSAEPCPLFSGYRRRNKTKIR